MEEAWFRTSSAQSTHYSAPANLQTSEVKEETTEMQRDDIVLKLLYKSERILQMAGRRHCPVSSVSREDGDQFRFQDSKLSRKQPCSAPAWPSSSSQILPCSVRRTVYHDTLDDPLQLSPSELVSYSIRCLLRQPLTLTACQWKIDARDSGAAAEKSIQIARGP
eukprot:752506-Hanusia_phi.AAC.17